MKRFVTRCLSLTACLGMLVPHAVLAEHPITNPHVQKTLDISLHDEGLLIGQVVNAQGKSQEGVSIRLIQHSHELIQTKTDKLGRFAVKGLKGGNYKIATNQMIVPVRAWPIATAPPGVAAGALLVEGTIVRGQDSILAPSNSQPIVDPEGIVPEPAEGEPYSPAPDGSPYYNGYASGHSYGGSGPAGGASFFRAGPLLLGTGVAAAIAIPVALSSSNDDDYNNGATGGAGEPAS